MAKGAKARDPGSRTRAAAAAAVSLGQRPVLGLRARSEISVESQFPHLQHEGRGQLSNS